MWMHVRRFHQHCQDTGDEQIALNALGHETHRGDSFTVRRSKYPGRLFACELQRRCCLETLWRPVSLKNVTVILCFDSRTSLPTENIREKHPATFIFLWQLIFCTVVTSVVRLKSTRLRRLFSSAPTRRSSAAASCAWLDLSGKL
jgi:hypothetical protein